MTITAIKKAVRDTLRTVDLVCTSQSSNAGVSRMWFNPTFEMGNKKINVAKTATALRKNHNMRTVGKDSDTIELDSKLFAATINRDSRFCRGGEVVIVIYKNTLAGEAERMGIDTTDLSDMDVRGFTGRR